MSICKKCGATIVWPKKTDGSFAPPQNPDGTRHNCDGGQSAPSSEKRDWKTGKLVSYGSNQAVLILEDLKEHTFALRSEVQKAWASAEYLMPMNNHPDVWLRFGKDAQGLILTGAEKVSPAPWASKLTDPTGGAVTPVQKKIDEPVPAPQADCTSPESPAPAPKSKPAIDRQMLIDMASTGREEYFKAKFILDLQRCEEIREQAEYRRRIEAINSAIAFHEPMPVPIKEIFETAEKIYKNAVGVQ